MHNLPVIPLAPLARGDRATVQRIGEAAEHVGFFRITEHGIGPRLIADTYDAARGFFARPEAEKQRLYIGAGPSHRGYVPFSERGDYADETHRSYEAFDIGHHTPLGAGPQPHRLIGPNVWPDLPGFEAKVSRYFAAVTRLGHVVCAALEQYLGLKPMAITGHMTQPISQLRLMHYVRHAAEAMRSVNMGAHTDYECVTILHTANEGLQVMMPEGRWIDVPADPGAFVVNIGDMLEAWSNGRLRSTPHRVLNLSAERYSLPFFVAPSFDTRVQPFPELVPPGTSPKYQPFEAGAHIARMLERDFPYLRRMGQGRVANPFEARIKRQGVGKRG